MRYGDYHVSRDSERVPADATTRIGAKAQAANPGGLATWLS